MPEGIDQSGIEKTAESVDFNLGITGRFIVIRLRARNIDFLVCDVKIAASDQRFLLLQLPAIGQKLDIPSLAVIQPGQCLARIRDIHVEQVEIFEFGDDHAAFAVMLDNTDVADNLQRLLPG